LGAARSSVEGVDVQPHRAAFARPSLRVCLAQDKVREALELNNGLELRNGAASSRGKAGPRTRWRPAKHSARPGTWSHERIVEAIRDWTQVTGGPPRAYEWVPSVARALGRYNDLCRLWEREYPRWPSSRTAGVYFGTWAEALKAAGVPVVARRPPGTLHERVEAARMLAAQGLSRREIAELLEVTPSTVWRYLHAHRCACGEPVTRSNSSPPRCLRCAHQPSGPRWDETTLLAAYRAWVAETGSRPVKRDWAPQHEQAKKWHRDYPRWPSANEVRTVFGQWGAMVEAAGDDRRWRRQPEPTRWTPEEILGALRRRSQELGRCPRSEDLGGAGDVPSVATVRKRFGSLSAALAELGLRPEGWRRGRDGYTEDELLAALRGSRDEFGRPPRSIELEGRHPGRSAIIRRFGSWGAALRAAGVASEESGFS
jgi:hypothetical protein